MNIYELMNNIVYSGAYLYLFMPLNVCYVLYIHVLHFGPKAYITERSYFML